MKSSIITFLVTGLTVTNRRDPARRHRDHNILTSLGKPLSLPCQ
ncbi:unnamed protein product [Brassica oleracea]